MRTYAKEPWGHGNDTNGVGKLKIKTPLRTLSLALELFRARQQAPSTLSQP